MIQSSSLYHWLTDSQKRTTAAFKYKKNRLWHTIGWNEYLKMVVNTSLIFKSILKNKEQAKIALISQSRWEWCIIDIATMASGHIMVPLYPNQADQDLVSILNNAEPEIVIVEDSLQEKQILKIKKKLKFKFKLLVLTELKFKSHSIASTHVKQFMKRAKLIQPEDIATIVYTSGTTGQSKGVVLNHAALLSEITDTFNLFEIDTTYTSLTFLPFAHVLGRVEHLGSLYSGHTLAFAESVEKLRKNLIEIKPDFLVAVPRIFEKVYANILAQIETQSIKKALFNRALRLSEKKNYYKKTHQSIPLIEILQMEFLNQFVFKKIQNIFGGRLRFAICGGAPMSEKLVHFFKDLGIDVLIGYGLTETFAAVTVNTPGHHKLGTVGKPIGHTLIKLDHDNEILVKSDKCFTEYYKNPKATKAAFTSEGFFKTGDIGEITPDGYLKITDRKKDLIKTSGGKYVAPQKLENLLKQCSAISQVLIIGDQKKFISAIINVEPLELTHEVRNQVVDFLQKLNSKLSSYESIKKFEIVSDPWTTQNGFLTPSLKVKRRVLEAHYLSIIKDFYNLSD